jgi:hypothetical protein
MSLKDEHKQSREEYEAKVKSHLQDSETFSFGDGIVKTLKDEKPKLK